MLLAALTICLCAGPAAARADSCPNANLTPRPNNLERVRTAALCLINQARVAHGESALQFNGRLEQAAQHHSEEMALGDYFEHTGPNGDTPLDRMRASGYIYNSHIGYEVGENIAWGTLWLATPRAIVKAWLTSSEHRANILDPRFRDTAIGVSSHAPASLAHGQSGAIYTQDFGVIIAGRAARYNLRPLTTKRRHKGYGSTRRQVRHRHRLGTRHRTRHR
jgi:uncharacterized protein YkwD